jgi:D-methionine transport system substrate-binding protein
MELVYRSTRNAQETATASMAILKGLANEGGLFVPDTIPAFDKSLEELPDGATIAVPNDGSNESRAIKLLADNGLITLAETEDLYNLTSIAENPHNFEITELDAANLPRSLDDVDAAVINGNYALEANLNPEKDALAAELADSDESYKYINYLVVKEGNEESTKTKALIAALQNDDVKNYIEEKYSGSVIPAF